MKGPVCRPPEKVRVWASRCHFPPPWVWSRDGSIVRAQSSRELEIPESSVCLLRKTEDIWLAESLGINKSSKLDERPEWIDDENTSFKERNISEKSTEPENPRVPVLPRIILVSSLCSGDGETGTRRRVGRAICCTVPGWAKPGVLCPSHTDSRNGITGRQSRAA